MEIKRDDNEQLPDPDAGLQLRPEIAERLRKSLEAPKEAFLSAEQVWFYKDRCHTRVYRRETYRYTGRGRNGFERHYAENQCSRKAKFDGFCWQHKKLR